MCQTYTCLCEYILPDSMYVHWLWSPELLDGKVGDGHFITRGPWQQGHSVAMELTAIASVQEGGGVWMQGPAGCIRAIIGWKRGHVIHQGLQIYIIIYSRKKHKTKTFSPQGLEPYITITVPGHNHRTFSHARTDILSPPCLTVLGWNVQLDQCQI